MIYGYARVSTKEQNLDRQLEALRKVVLDERNIIVDKLTRNGQRKKVSSRTNKPIGRPQIAFPEKWEIFYDKWKNSEITAKCCMQHLGLKRSTFYKLAKIYDEKS